MSNKKSQQKDPVEKKRGNQLKNVALLSGIAFQMAIITGLGAYIGHRLDLHYSNETPIITIILTFIGFGISMYMVVKQTNKLTNQKNDPKQ